jgi:putative CocE/NonD family hydrolase
VWRTYDTWPPKTTSPRKIYFHANGKLSFDPPRTPGVDEYVHDPKKPVPFSAEVRTTQGHLWMIEDQRFAAMRPDVMVYESEPLTEDVTIAGPIVADLHASTSGTDADWVVKLIDVLPGNTPNNEPNPAGVRMGHFQMLLAGEVLRAKYRQSYEKPVPLVPGQATNVAFELRDRYHTFKKGHRIMVQVQSSWFPVIDRNPGVFTNIYHARPEQYRRTTQRIHRSPGRASHLVVQVLEPAGEMVP